MKLTKRISSPILLLVAIGLFSFSCLKQENTSLIYNAQCENLINPLGIGTASPGLSWKTRSDKNKTLQTAYQLLVASDSSLLDEKKADLWNSGKIVSAASVLVPYNGKPLDSKSVAYWKVRIWDENKEISQWSKIASFTVVFLHLNDWKADFIGMAETKDLPQAPLLRQTFNLTQTGQKTLLVVNSLGYHEIILNGQKVGNAVLTPSVAQFNKRSQVITYDIAPYVKPGENDLVIALGRGWYNTGLPGVVNDGPLVRAQLEQLNSGKWETLLSTNTTWKCRASEYIPIGNWRAHQFGGEQVDGSRKIADWSKASLDQLDWIPVTKVEIPEHLATAQMTEPNRIQETLKATSVTAIGDKSYLVDLGKSMTGWLEVRFPTLQKGQKIVMDYCDHLDKDGKFVDRKQSDVYVASGKGPESFINKFNYHGFRWVRISNLPEMPTKESVTGYLIHTDYQLASTFKSSDEDLNKIHDMIFYTLRCLSLGGYLVDCPQLERLGYGGDGNASTETAQMMFNLSPLYANWLQAWGDCINADGGMPHTAPNPYPAGGGPYWCGFIISASWKTYQNYGDARILEKYYPEMRQWLTYVEKYSPTGLLQKWPDTEYRGWYLGDWASPEGIKEKSMNSVDVVNNSFVVRCYDDMTKIASVLGKTEDIQKYAQKRDDLKKKVHLAFYDERKFIYGDGNQIDLTYPLLAEIVPVSLIKQVTSSLKTEVVVKRGGHIACGLVGVPVFTEWATKNLETDLVYSMLKKRDYPGYLYMIDNGATTTWENWSNPRSYIHNCFNGIGSWFYEAVGGIRKEQNSPGFQKVMIRPQVPTGVTWANTTKETPYGTLVVNWKVEGDDLNLHLEIPVGITAKVVLPEGVSQYQMNQKSLKLKKDQSGIEILSGKYDLVYKNGGKK